MKAIECGLNLSHNESQSIQHAQWTVWRRLTGSRNQNACDDRGFIYRVFTVQNNVIALCRVKHEWVGNLSSLVRQNVTDCPFQEVGAKHPVRVRLEPVTHRLNGGRRNVIDVEQWVKTLFEHHGMSVNELKVGEKEKYLLRRGAQSTITVTMYDCMMQVQLNDVEKAQHAWLNGIGRARAFGAGMIITM